MSLLTLGLLVERLPAAVVPQPDPPDLPDFNPQEVLRNNINRVLERFYAEGKWEGLITRAVINAYTDADNHKYITLPRHLETCLRGGVAGYMTRAVQSEWYQYLPQGRGIRLKDLPFYGPLQDLGEGYPIFRDLPSNSQLTISSNETECEGSYIWIRGNDANGDKITSTVDGVVIDGIRLDLGNPAAPQITSETFSTITSVEKTPTVGTITLSGASVTLGLYEAGERVASYRRYLIDQNWDNVNGIFKRRFCWAVSDNDPIYPPSLEAIKLGLMALNAEEKMDVERGQYYMDRAIALLNAELKEYNSGQEGTFQVAPWMTRNMINMR